MKYLLPILIGAIIGYFTNWLAIKMLFRPHTEKRLFGVVVPFTPGLIPKERARMAETVGQTVGTHLLSPEVVSEALYNTRVKVQIERWILEKISKLEKSNMLIKEMLINTFGIGHSEFLNKLQKKIAVLVCSQLRSEKFKISVTDIILKEFFEMFDKKTYSHLKQRLQQYIFNFTATEEVKESLKSIIGSKLKELEDDDRELNEILPPDISESINVYLDEQSNKVTEFIKDVIKSEPVEERLKTGIADIVKQNVSSVITMFISPESMAEGIYDSMQEYIGIEENKSSIITTIKTIVDKLLSTKISNLIKGLSIEDREKGSIYLLEVVLGYIVNKQNQEKLFDVVEQKIKSSENEVKDKILSLVSNKLNAIIEHPQLDEYILKVLKDIIDDILNRPLSSIFQDLHLTTGRITSNLVSMIDVFAKTKASSVIELLNISKLVEKQINSFDVAFAEKLIIEIANKELKAITWFGAVLGGVIGSLTPVLQHFY
jgi:uncharacterized membrane protein YheB (UPF0754 family)